MLARHTLARACTPRTGCAAFCTIVSDFSTVEILAKKRDGLELETGEIDHLVRGFYTGEIPDYQMSAFLMATYMRGMTNRETADLTLAMTNSGRVLDHSDIPGFKVDKHSTGGVGDKVSLPLAPVIAACGLVDPMMSGRGLGHTGGTLDKLESIPGFQVDLTAEKFSQVLRDVGCAIISPTADVAPADKAIYALRDVTATVASIPLIVGSIMSKKIAEGPEALVLDIKSGSGAFLKDFNDGVELAHSMIAAGENAGIQTVAMMTSMDEPLGAKTGNWLEIEETIEILRGSGPDDVRRIVVAQAAQMLRMAGAAPSLAAGAAQAELVLADGSALAKFGAMVEAQGGDARLVLDEEYAAQNAPRAAHERTIVADHDGAIRSIDCLECGLTNVGLGAGRQRVEDVIDPAAGMIFHAKCGEVVREGQPLVTLRAATPDLLDRGAARVSAAIDVADPNTLGQLPTLISHLVDKDGVKEWDTYFASN